MKTHKYSILYIVIVLFSFTGSLYAQNPLTDRIVIEFMEPGDRDAEARNYNILSWPEEAKAAAYKAAEIWASYLEINVPIRVKFGWCDNIEEAGIGSSIYTYQYTDGYYYPLSLINQLLGYDKNKDVVDIICVFKDKLKIGWYFGIDGEIGLTPAPDIPGAQYFQEDFLTIALHEICHGLGLTTTMKVKSGQGKWGGSVSGKANIYDKFLVDNMKKQLINESFYVNNSENLAAALTSDNIFWNGHYAIAANNGEFVKIHAPNKWIDKNSICHIDGEYSKTENSLMSGLGFEGGNHQHTPGPIVLGMLQDMGWKLKESSTDTEVVSISKIKVSVHAGIVSISDASINESVRIYEISGKMVYNGRISSDRMEITVSGHGIYIVRVGNECFKISN